MLVSVLRRFEKSDVVAILLVFLIALIHLPYPFHGDQALFAIGAKKISAGGVLYRDFWDIKQPGIYVFYLCGGKLFGFTETGIHTFELLYWLAFSVLLILTLREKFATRWGVSLVPLFTIGVYYGASTDWHLTQVESLAGFPLYMSLWSAHRSLCEDRVGKGWLLFLSGLMGGVAVMLKLLFLPVVLTFWVTLSAVRTRRLETKDSIRQICRHLFLILLGFSLVIGVAGLYFISQQAFGIFIWTTFEWPLRLLNESLSASLIDKAGTLFSGFHWFLLRFSPLLALGAVAAVRTIRVTRDPLFINMILWVVVGLLVIFVQTSSYWEYQYLLLFVPIGILAAKGLDILWDHMKNVEERFGPAARLTMVLAVIMLFSPVLLSLTERSLRLSKNKFAVSSDNRLSYQSKVSRYYKEILKHIDILTKPDSIQGRIYVFGNPLYLYLSSRDQAIRLTGWAAENWVNEQWDQFSLEVTNQPPAYILVQDPYHELLRKNALGTARFIEGHYNVIHRDLNGTTWYELKDPHGRGPYRPIDDQAPAGPETRF